MKKLIFLSVLIAVLTAFSCVSAFSTSAAETKTVSSIEIVEIPDDIYTKNIDEMLYGVKIKIGYTDDTSETFTVSQDNAEYEYSVDYLESLACSCSSLDISVGGYSYVTLKAYNFVADFIQIDATAYVDFSDESSLKTRDKIDYPEDYELPEIFCKDFLVYRNNFDDTLTLINHTIEPDYYSEDYVQAPIVIPETIHGKTVTSVADYALLGTTHPSSVTIPGTVTSIGEYAFGYCFSPDSCGHNHNIPDNVFDSRLSWKLADAADDDTFIVSIHFYNEDPKAQSDSLKNNYLSDCADYEFDEDTEYAYATLTKAQIYSMQDVDDIMINPEYEKNTGISEDIYDFAEYIGNDEKMSVEISIYTENLNKLNAACKELSNKYFGGRTDYIVDEYGFMRIDATFSEIKAVSQDPFVGYIYFYGADGIYYDLYKELYDKDSDYKTDIFALDYSEEPTSDNYMEYAETYFANCEYEIFSCEGQQILIVKDASKQQIFDAGLDENFGIELFDSPLVNSYNDIVIYGENGSAAQRYAENNLIKFVGTGGEYQLGDVNHDGKITVSDATEILKFNVDLVTFTDEQKALADFDQNGVINVMDASELQRAIVNS